MIPEALFFTVTKASLLLFVWNFPFDIGHCKYDGIALLNQCLCIKTFKKVSLGLSDSGVMIFLQPWAEQARRACFRFGGVDLKEAAGADCTFKHAGGREQIKKERGISCVQAGGLVPALSAVPG